MRLEDARMEVVKTGRHGTVQQRGGQPCQLSLSFFFCRCGETLHSFLTRYLLFVSLEKNSGESKKEKKNPKKLAFAFLVKCVQLTLFFIIIQEVNVKEIRCPAVRSAYEVLFCYFEQNILQRQSTEEEPQPLSTEQQQHRHPPQRNCNATLIFFFSHKLHFFKNYFSLRSFFRVCLFSYIIFLSFVVFLWFCFVLSSVLSSSYTTC